MNKILVPLNNRSRLKDLVEAGADEFYMGFHDEEWVKEFDQCIKSEKAPKYLSLREGETEKGVIIIANSTSKEPDWVKFLNCISEEKVEV